jgi:hypothetical protein
MLSEFEYVYWDPGSNSSGRSAAKDNSSSGGGGTSIDAPTAAPNASVLMKSGTPLVWLNNWRNVTAPQASGRSGSRSAIVSSSDSTPESTSASAVAPLNALATLAMRMW